MEKENIVLEDDGDRIVRCNLCGHEFLDNYRYRICHALYDVDQNELCPGCNTAGYLTDRDTGSSEECSRLPCDSKQFNVM